MKSALLYLLSLALFAGLFALAHGAALLSTRWTWWGGGTAAGALALIAYLPRLL
jgi:hypothetical protein